MTMTDDIGVDLAPATGETTQTSSGKIVRRTPSRAETNYRQWARRQKYLHRGLAIAVPVVLLATWQVASSRGWVDVRFFSSPSRIWDRAGLLIENGELLDQLTISVRRLILGYSAGSIAGIVVGLLLNQFRTLQAAFEPTLRALYVIPKLAILPILLLVLGIGEMPRLFFIALGVFYIMAFSTLTAVTMVPHTYHEAASAYGLTRMQRFRWVVLPGAMPQIVAALRLASGIGVLLVVAVEFVNASDGVGHMTWHAWELFVADKMYVGIVTVSVMGVLFSVLIGSLGRILCPWDTSNDRLSR